MCLFLFKVNVLKRIAVEYSCECFLLHASVDGGVNEITRAWGDVGGIIMYVVQNSKDSMCKISSNWLITVVGEYCSVYILVALFVGGRIWLGGCI